MLDIGAKIKDGAKAFLFQEYLICSGFCILFAGVIFLLVDQYSGLYSTAAFLVGAATSMFCGYICMMIATSSNFRTSFSAVRSLEDAFHVA